MTKPRGTADARRFMPMSEQRFSFAFIGVYPLLQFFGLLNTFTKNPAHEIAYVLTCVTIGTPHAQRCRLPPLVEPSSGCFCIRVFGGECRSWKDRRRASSRNETCLPSGRSLAAVVFDWVSHLPSSAGEDNSTNLISTPGPTRERNTSTSAPAISTRQAAVETALANG